MSAAITRDDVLAARDRISRYVRRTPMLAPGGGSDRYWFKLELLQHTGVFKVRGAFNRQLAARESGDLDPAVGICVASGGNAGLAHAYAAQVIGVPATVFVPETTPQVKVDLVRGYGAQVRQVGTEYAHAHAAAVDHAAGSGALYCHAYDQPEIVAGAGTIAEEILEDEPGIDTVVVAVGGGGLYGGLAASCEGRARVVVVEPVTAPTLHRALAAGHPVDVAVSGVASDSLGARRAGDIAFAIAQRTPPVCVLVDDDAIVSAREALWRDHRIPSEHGAATAYAGLSSGAYQPSDGERVAVLVCGANTDVSTLSQHPAPEQA